MDKHLSYWESDLDVDLFRKWHQDNEAHSRDMQRIKSKVIYEKYESVLDIGAGTGDLYHLFDNKINYQGLEITPKFVEYAKEHNIPMILGDIVKLPFEDNSYDVCIASGVLNHLYDYRPAIKEMARVAKKEMIISFFKPSLERLETPSSMLSLAHIGYYHAKDWDNVGKVFSCPQIGFYPNRFLHCSLAKLLNQQDKPHKSSLGFYTHYREDESGEPTCIHHYFKYSQMFEFFNNLASERGEIFTMQYDGEPNLFNSKRLHDSYSANVFFIKISKGSDDV